MVSLLRQADLARFLSIFVLGIFWCEAAIGVGVNYADPGWFYAYDGDEAYYNDPDGPNPDYVNGDDLNFPGGQGGTAALVFPGYVDEPGCNPDTGAGCSVDNDAGMWVFQSSNWDGSAPGETLGGTPGSSPPIPPAAPGGVGTFLDGTTSFIRLQDPGQPQNWGWPDKGAQACETCARQEGNNRKIQFAHKMNRDDMFSEDHAVIDNGITISFRTRLATAATGPIDDIYVEGGPGVSPPVTWPADGLGYEVSNQGRGMFHIAQTNANGLGQQMAFSILDNDTITFEGLPFENTQTGLVMNNRASAAAANDVDTNEATSETLNLVEVANEDLDEWHEFWITIEAIQLGGDGVPIANADGNTHEVNVYLDGSLEPETYEIVLAPENEFGTGAHLGLGLSSGSRQGAYDVDFYAYMEGVVVPSSGIGPGDFDKDGDVDGDDFLIWQANFGTQAGATSNTGDADSDGDVDGDDFLVWQANFGSGGGSAASAIPEPSSLAVLVVAVAACLPRRRSER